MFTRPSQIKVKRVIIINATNVTPLQILPASPLAARLPNTQNKLIKCSVRHGNRSAFIRPPFTSLTWGTCIMTHVFRAAIAPPCMWNISSSIALPPAPRMLIANAGPLPGCARLPHSSDHLTAKCVEENVRQLQ